MVADRMGYSLILWSHEMNETAYLKNPPGQVQEIIDHARPGQIILAHDVGSSDRYVALSQLGALSGGTSGLGSLGGSNGSNGSSGSSGSTGSSGSSGASGGTSATQAQAYLNCISGASTAAAIQRCQALAP